MSHMSKVLVIVAFTLIAASGGVFLLLSARTRGPTTLAMRNPDPFLDRARGLWGYKSSDGNVLIEARFIGAHDFRGNRAVIMMDDGYGFIDLQGNVVARGYTLVWPFKEGRAKVFDGSKFGFIDLDGVEVVPMEYGAVLSFSEGVAAVDGQGGFGFIDHEGRLVIERQYRMARSFSNGMAAVLFSEPYKWGYIDKQGNTVISPQFDEAEAFGTNTARVRVGEEWFQIDKQGREVSATKSDHRRDR